MNGILVTNHTNYIHIGSGVLWSVGVSEFQIRQTKCRKRCSDGDLSHRISVFGMQYIDRGWVTQDEYETLCELYKPYVKLGGNGSGTKIMKEVEKLPIKGGLK